MMSSFKRKQEDLVYNNDQADHYEEESKGRDKDKKNGRDKRKRRQKRFEKRGYE